ncbi:hypothetical protein FIV42_04500 [Persicimonas caeni]|uniref:Tetratricopeptide repeat protein n=1 Tax=Persicimonas caeni TaxID=2292766 RepID=A0A4Y6PNX5_PERCE|nr:hypothetical protein [Persicimonas caeni]QDG50026.1 hypothetical protein FIV42_04500 [Persicimonas caeni]QED31247.1 hypothetical protein FRD00_04495 [Persicimonas caeni]
MLERLYPKFVSLLGALGLACSLGYFVGVYLAFQPEWQDWADFFVPAAIPLLIVPYVLLLSHLYLRTHLGAWLLKRGAVDQAIDYCSARLSSNLMRGRKEALIHRVNLARALVVRGEYERAYETLSAGYAKPDKGAQAVNIARWRMEVALRKENLIQCHEAYEAAAELTRPKGARAYLLGCRAELAVREGKRGEFDESIEEGLWAKSDNPRVRLCQVLGALRFGASHEELTEALALLEQAFAPAVTDVPRREGELLACRAELLWELGRKDEARETIAFADEVPQDTRSEYEIRRVRERITASPQRD